jgi:CubicO group peptidase (beta-lactamase class C family)
MMLKRMIPWTTLVVAILVAAGYIGQRQSASELDIRTARRLEQQLESLRQRLRTPSFAAGIARDGELVWAKGFGYADVENQIEPTEHTPYHLASLTKTFASTILLQLVEEGLVDLDASITDYGLEIPSDGVITVRHLFSHTSEDPPGRYYRYNGARFGRLDWIIRAVTSESFGDLLEERIVRRTGLDDTSPSQ